MRIDKFLKISLLFKTRSGAEKSIEDGHVLINNKPAKPSSNIKINDIITLILPAKTLCYKVIMLAEKNVTREQAKDLYELLSEEINEF